MVHRVWSSWNFPFLYKENWTSSPKSIEPVVAFKLPFVKNKRVNFSIFHNQKKAKVFKPKKVYEEKCRKKEAFFFFQFCGVLENGFSLPLSWLWRSLLPLLFLKAILSKSSLLIQLKLPFFYQKKKQKGRSMKAKQKKREREELTVTGARGMEKRHWRHH